MRKYPGSYASNTGVVTPLRLGWNGCKHPGAGGVSTRVVEECESIGCALTPQSMRSAKAEAANMVRKGVLRAGLNGPRGEESKVLGL